MKVLIDHIRYARKKTKRVEVKLKQGEESKNTQSVSEQPQKRKKMAVSI